MSLAPLTSGGVKLLPSPLVSTNVTLNLLPSTTWRGASTVKDAACTAITVKSRMAMLMILFIDLFLKPKA